MAFIAIRSDNGYIGFAKQSQQNTGAAPTQFYRWLDGSGIEVDAKMEEIWEGDGSRHLSQLIKNRQSAKIKLITNVRPNDVGFLECAAMGAGSDAYTAPTVATVLSAATLVGATSISVATNTGLTGTGTIALALEAGTATEEIPTFTLPASGVGPYTLTVAPAYNGGTLKTAHANTGTVKSSASHVLTDQSDGSYYSGEVSIGGTAGIIIRLRDCKVEEIKRSGKAGTYISYEVTFSGIACLVQATPATVTFDPHTPYLFQQGTWTLDGSTTGDALAVTSFDISQKNNLDLTIQAEQLTLAAIIFGNLTMEFACDIVFQNGNRIAETYFGGVAGTVDAQAVAQGNLLLVFALPDGLNTLTYQVTTLEYSKVGVPQLKKDGKAFRTPISAASVSNQSANPWLLETTLANTSYAAY
ncbi:MAG: hypothetical protein IVW57_00195 [Ktedonobacterales bacterium]|nr:hypothetical protein [Ktedonobacterales bacterium]